MKEFISVMAKVITGAVLVFLLSSVFSRVIPTKHDLVVVENHDQNENANVENNDDEDFYDPSLGPFIPTKEWQVVKRGQRIPAGLHVRLDFKTKIREAKLMDGDDGSSFQNLSDLTNKKKTCLANENCHGDDNIGDVKTNIKMNSDGQTIAESERSGEKVYFTKSQLKDAIQEFRDKLAVNSPSDMTNIKKERNIDLVRGSFKTLEEVRAELKQNHNFYTKSDTEIIRSYLTVLQGENSTEQEKEVALEDLEFFSHQRSSAIDLAKMNGIEAVVYYLNQSRNEVLQEKSAKVIAAAVQSNPTVQDSALSSGAVPVLLRIMSTTNVLKLKKRTLYALSALLRGHLQSQKLFMKLYGLGKILDIIRNKDNGNVRLQGVTLITDILTEQREVLAELMKKKKVADKKGASVISAIANHGWCEVLPGFLKSQDLDTLEKVLQALVESKAVCAAKLKNTELPFLMPKVIKYLRIKYEEETDTEFRDYVRTLQHTAEGILS